MSKKTILWLWTFLLPVFLTAQTSITFPPVLNGNDIALTLQKSNKEFYTGFSTSTVGYNGNYLGPTIMLQQGQELTLHVTNLLGDTTTTHWHGLHVSPMNDGGPHTLIMDGETWSPSFTVMDKAGTYWYHPHLHHKTLPQVVKGAAGLIIVKDAEEAALALPRNYGVDDLPLIFQFQTINNTTKQIELNDEFDNTVLVNGTVNGMVDAPAQVVRLRLLNASSHRVFRFGFADNHPFMQIASDAGLLNAPVSLTRLTLGPGERAEILVNLSGEEGSTLFLKTYGNELPTGYPGGAAMMGAAIGPLDNISFNVLQLNVVSPTPNPINTIPSMLTSNSVWSQTGASTRAIQFSAQPMMSMTNFFINNVKFDEEVINFTTMQEDVEVWNITNQTMMAHPFHIHGNHFYVLEINGATPPPNMLGRKDVVIVPPMNGSVKLITKYEDFGDSDMPYMYHCHILSHEDNGMMGQFLVTPLATGLTFAPNAEGIKLYPNPAVSNITLQSNAVLEKAELKIMNVLGEIVLQKVITNTYSAEIDISALAKGIYIVQIGTPNSRHTEKLIKQ